MRVGKYILFGIDVWPNLNHIKWLRKRHRYISSWLIKQKDYYEIDKLWWVMMNKFVCSTLSDVVDVYKDLVYKIRNFECSSVSLDCKMDFGLKIFIIFDKLICRYTTTSLLWVVVILFYLNMMSWDGLLTNMTSIKYNI